MKDLISTSTDSALTVQYGDLEIAGNQLKISAWLAAIATAGLYFCFNSPNNQYIYLSNSFSKPYFYPYIARSFLFGFSLIAAYKFHKIHNHFCALSRNAICAYKMQQADLLQAINYPAFLKSLKDNENPFWGMAVNGDLWELTQTGKGQLIKEVLQKVEVFRGKVDIYLEIQKILTLIGFILIIIANAYFSIK